MALFVRPVRLEDARVLSEVHIASWRWAYPGIVPQAVLDALDVDKRSAEYAAWFAESRAQGRFDLLAEEEGQVLGFAGGGPFRPHPPKPPHPPTAQKMRGGSLPPPQGEGLAGFDGELYAVYLAQNALGRGIGRALVGAVFGQLKARGFKKAAVWVLEKNSRARGFYERLGGQLLPQRASITIGIPLEEVAYGWESLPKL